MDAIINNPFRILGLPTKASEKEIAKRVSDLLIYAEMGKKVSYETDFLFLGKLDRSIESIKLAAKKIELPENKIFYSLLCFDLNDNVEKKSIEFIEQGDFQRAYDILKNKVDNDSPTDYYSTTGENINNILRNIGNVDNSNYSIQKEMPSTSAGAAALVYASVNGNKKISIKSNLGLIEISEANYQLELTDKYQISCSFKWLSPLKNQEESLGLGFITSSNEKHIILISQSGILRYFKSDRLEFEYQIDKSIFDQNKSNSLSLQRYDNCIDIVINNSSLTKIKTKESFKSSLLCFSGVQKIAINNLFISGLKRKGLSDISKLDEKTFSYLKNISILLLLRTLHIKTLEIYLLNYFQIVGNILKNQYFSCYVKTIISNTYSCNISLLTDVFIKELYSSLNQFIDPNDEYSQNKLYGTFAYLSDGAEKKVKDLSMGSRPYLFDIFIKETAIKRGKYPDKAFNLASELKNEAAHFYKWHLQFYGYGHLVSKSISDKIGNEILDCAIAYYNATIPKTIDVAKQSLKAISWASDFAFNQELRDRINKNISILIESHKITDFVLVDFDFKDKIRFKESVIFRGQQIDNKTINIQNQEPINSYKEEKSKKNKSTTNVKQTIYIPIKKPNIGKRILQKLRKVELVYFLYGFILMIVLIVIFIPDDRQHIASNNKMPKESQPIYKNEENTSPDQNIVNDNSTINRKPNLNIDLSHYKPREQETEAIEESKWKGNKLSNGDSPYDEYFGRGVYDYNSECYLIFKNGYSTDAIVCLENTTTGRTIRNEYIQAGTDFKMTNIPEGVYKVKTFSGNDWNPEKTLDQGAIKGAFDTDLSFSVSDNPSDLIKMTIRETMDGISYSTGEITLYKVSHGNMQQRNINSDEFFK